MGNIYISYDITFATPQPFYTSVDDEPVAEQSGQYKQVDPYTSGTTVNPFNLAAQTQNPWVIEKGPACPEIDPLDSYKVINKTADRVSGVMTYAVDIDDSNSEMYLTHNSGKQFTQQGRKYQMQSVKR